MPVDLDALTAETLLAQFKGNRSILQKVVPIFIQQAPQYLINIQDALSSKEPLAISRATHTLKGAIGYVTSEEPFKMALQMEILSRENNLLAVEALYPQLKEEVECLSVHLAQLMAEFPVSEC